MTDRIDRTFVDPHGVTVHYYQWNAAQPKAVIQIAHGLGDHALRYEAVAAELAANGYTVYADDHRGHGATGMGQWGDATKLGTLGPGGLRATVADVRQLTGIIRTENPGLRVAMIGHSWGSLIAQINLNEHPEDFDAIVLTGTALRAPGHMNGGDLNARHKNLGTTGYEWLSRDPAISQAFADDPLAFTASAIKQFGLADTLRLLGKPARDLAVDVPLLIQIGSDDPFGGVTSVELLAEAYISRSGLTDVEVIVYTDARHEIFNETNRTEVLADTVAWLDARLLPAPA